MYICNGRNVIVPVLGSKRGGRHMVAGLVVAGMNKFLEVNMLPTYIYIHINNLSRRTAGRKRGCGQSFVIILQVGRYFVIVLQVGRLFVIVLQVGRLLVTVLEVGRLLVTVMKLEPLFVIDLEVGKDKLIKEFGKDFGVVLVVELGQCLVNLPEQGTVWCEKELGHVYVAQLSLNQEIFQEVSVLINTIRLAEDRTRANTKLIITSTPGILAL